MDRKVIKMTNEARWADGQTARNRLDDITVRLSISLEAGENLLEDIKQAVK